jgi:ribonuclease HI
MTSERASANTTQNPPPRTRKKRVEIFTDGACKGNPGPGGFGALLRYGKNEKQISGGEKSTTNNRMEMTAAIRALEVLKEPCDITLFSDSKYLVDAINLGWVVKWRKNGWMRTKKERALNVDLWERLLALLEIHDYRLMWVKGHAGHRENEICDKLATAAAESFK